MDTVKLYVGSGYAHLPGFVRVDIDPKCQPDILADASDLRSAIDPAKYDVAEIRAHHILEHFFISKSFGVMRNWWETLKPGGRLEIAVPDCDYAARAYYQELIDHNQLVKLLAGGDQQANDWMLHKNFFTPARLERLLFITGFVRVKDIRTKIDELKYEAFRPEVGE